MREDKIIIKRKFDEDTFFEMSKPLDWVIEKIRSLEPQINKHLLKLLLFKQESNWKKSVSNWLVDISTYTVKPNDKFLKKLKDRHSMSISCYILLIYLSY